MVRKLALIRRTFSHCIPVHIKKYIYTALVKSQLLYGSQVWRPSLIRDIKSLERIQRRATKYVLNDYTSNYKERLVALNLLPLMSLNYMTLCFSSLTIKILPPQSENMFLSLLESQDLGIASWLILDP